MELELNFQQNPCRPNISYLTLTLVPHYLGKIKRLIYHKNQAPNSPDLNPVDYKVWAAMEHRLYQRKIRDIDELREQLTATWHNLKQSIIDSAIDQWRKRLTVCIEAKDGHFEYLL